MKDDYIKMVSEITGKPVENTEVVMNRFRKDWGVSHKEYYTHKFYEMTETQKIDKAKKLKRKKEARNAVYDSVSEKTGMTKKEILADIKRINGLDLLKVGVVMYDKWELYRMDEERLKKFLILFSKRIELKRQVKRKLLSIDGEQLSCDILQEEYNECREITREFMSEGLEKMLIDQIVSQYPELAGDEKLCGEVAVDMETNRFLLDYSYGEYIMFGFKDLSLDERREFLSRVERMAVFVEMNPAAARDLFNNKHLCYQRLKKHFCREQVLIEKKEDFPIFKAFCHKKKLVVKKPMVDALGRGVEPIHITRNTDLRALMNQLLKDNGPFVVEELIHMHRRMKKICPDSVNTVRIETYYNDGNPLISAVFMRMGKGGTFVDNGSAGGIMVSVDPAEGKILAKGCDVSGARFERHPSTGVKLIGYQLPNWDEAIDLAKTLAKEVPEMNYVGWDLTCNKRGKWIVVEGNAMPQGHQSSLGKGIRKAFFNTIGRNPNEFKKQVE